MTAQRSRKEEMQYRKYRAALRREKDQDCAFCSINEKSAQFLEKKKYFKVVQNIFPYSIWDGELVADHLMIVPISHTDKLGDLHDQAGSEFLRLVDKYEDLGYNLYARSPGSNIKSVLHQHSHLIKPLGKRRKFVFFSKKPYIRITF